MCVSLDVPLFLLAHNHFLGPSERSLALLPYMGGLADIIHVFDAHSIAVLRRFCV